MMASNPDENAERLYLREQIARFDQMHERIWRMREESWPRIDALLAQAARDREAIHRNDTNWPAIIAAGGAVLSGISAILAVLVAAHLI
ncbi:hypothetical protein [Acidiphilium sp. PM]|uniref:hypothetical protein n=1 Tax=Acidiphilium sp. PM TaxID=1043206 RepID=UPI0002144D24|nr:hypothetical protein [Acidiphilium sp. PM]EGO93367.1 hypothetical protein APM_3797 [Acidiphilium sp. PM]